MLKNLHFAFLLSLMLIVSCVTDKEVIREIPEYNEAMLNKIDSLIEAGQPARAVQICRSIEDPRIQKKEEESVSALITAYEKSFEERDFLQAVELKKSLLAIDVNTEPELSDLYLLEIDKKLESGDITPALSIFQNQIINKSNEDEKLTEIDNNLLKEIIDAALINKNKFAAEYIIKNYPEIASYKTDSVKALIKYIPETEELISGTVTIWVNRGIKLEDGIGYPDRIIGSGFYIDPRGYILTNYHVISSEVDTEYEGYSRLYIKYDKNEEKLPARVVGWDASLDIALLKVETKPKYFYNFGGDREYRSGEKLYAIGSPGGLQKTITSGIVSAVRDRRLLPLGDTIQVDVPINSGNSGGPVIDTNGNLVGVVFAGIEQFEGVNFVIPAEWILKSLTELYREGRNRQSWLGMAVNEDKNGLEIIYIMPGSSAFMSGLEIGDRIIEIDNVDVKTLPDAQSVIMEKRPGTLSKIKVDRNGNEKNFILVVEARDDVPMEEALELDSMKNLMAPFLGIAVKLGNQNFLGQEYIVEKVYRGTIADETGLSVNDPFSIVSWDIDEENEVLLIGIRIKKRKAGFLETVIQLGNYLDINNTI